MPKQYNLDWTNPVNTIAIGDNLDFFKVGPAKSSAARHCVHRPVHYKFSLKPMIFKFMRDRFRRHIFCESGVLYISIDSSLYDLKILCDELYGAKIHGVFITKQAVRSNSNHINTIHNTWLRMLKVKTELSSI